MTTGRVPFSNGTEVDMFRDNWCARCALRELGEADCEEFGLGVAMGEWPPLLTEGPRSAGNPLGLTCTKFDRPMDECNGICLTGYDVGLPSNSIAYAHPDCPAHGDPEGDPLTPEQEETMPADPKADRG